MAPVGSTRVACTPLPHPIISPRLVLCVLVLYGLAQSCARDVVMTKQHEMAASLGITAPDVSHTLSYGYISYAIGKLVYGEQFTPHPTGVRFDQPTFALVPLPRCPPRVLMIGSARREEVQMHIGMALPLTSVPSLPIMWFQAGLPT
jgi:hypothetical protein